MVLALYKTVVAVAILLCVQTRILFFNRMQREIKISLIIFYIFIFFIFSL